MFPLSFIRFHYIYSHFMQISCSILNVLQFTPKLCLLYYSWVLLHRVHHACQPDITCSQMGSPHVNYSIISQDYPFPNGFLRNTPGYGTRNNCKHLLLKLHAFGENIVFSNMAGSITEAMANMQEWIPYREIWTACINYILKITFTWCNSFRRIFYRHIMHRKR